jgi:hypothetical protein
MEEVLPLYLRDNHINEERFVWPAVGLKSLTTEGNLLKLYKRDTVCPPPLYVEA